jgi:ribonuclease D
MAKPHKNTLEPKSFRLLASLRSSISSVMARHRIKRRAKANQGSVEDLARWEDDGGASKRRTDVPQGVGLK